MGVLLPLSICLLTVASAGRAHAITPPPPSANPAPVASLEPAATAKLWRHLVKTRARRARAESGCRSLRAVFYAATDFLRLATKLAANASPCAQYYISIPALVADKTQPRPDQAWRIRALGVNFHALADINFSPWSRWVVSTGSSWYAAGTTARERMAAAGYDVSAGDAWALNELNSLVRRGDGSARANVREFLRGLYEGDGKRPTRGVVFVIGVGQPASNLSLYQTVLQSWFSDSSFWADMSTYVRDWSQEVYGDVRSYAVRDVQMDERLDYLNDYLQHPLVLANSGPATIDTARSYFHTAYSPLANAAWQHASGYGWTMVPPEQMASYVSAQVYALRNFSATSGQSFDHWGFAWAPINNSGWSGSDFAAKTGLVLDRLGAAVRDSAKTVDPEDPGSGACGPPGQSWCVGDIEDGHLNDAWKAFKIWTPAITFGTPTQGIPAGTPSAAMNLALVASTGGPFPTGAPLDLTLRSSSPRGSFATTPSGPWSSTLSLTIAQGASTSGEFYYLDTQVGRVELIASADGLVTATQELTVTPGPTVSLDVTPSVAKVQAGGTVELAATGSDAEGNVFPVSVAWALVPQRLGSLTTTTGTTTTFTAHRTLGDGTVTATFLTGNSTISAVAEVHVVPDALRIGSIEYRPGGTGVALVTVTALDAGGAPVSRAVVFVDVMRDGRLHYAARAVTDTAGHAIFRVPIRVGGCFTTEIRKVSAAGFAWDGRTPANEYCRPQVP